MLSTSNSYSLLGVNTSSTVEEVKAAYFRLARLYHPDKVKQTDSKAPSFVSIRNAYEAVQADLQRRKDQKAKEYDRLTSQIVNLIDAIYNDSDSEEEEINDAYFDQRIKMMNQKYAEIQTIFKTSQTKKKSFEEATDTDSSEQDGSRKNSGGENLFIDPIKKKRKSA